MLFSTWIPGKICWICYLDPGRAECRHLYKRKGRKVSWHNTWQINVMFNQCGKRVNFLVPMWLTKDVTSVSSQRMTLNAAEAGGKGHKPQMSVTDFRPDSSVTFSNKSSLTTLAWLFFLLNELIYCSFHCYTI